MAGEKEAAVDAAQKAIDAKPASKAADEWEAFHNAIADLDDKAIAWANAAGADVSDMTATLSKLVGNLAEKAKEGLLDLEKDGAEIATALNSVGGLKSHIESK
jgi:hypothetical protein